MTHYEDAAGNHVEESAELGWVFIGEYRRWKLIGFIPGIDHTMDGAEEIAFEVDP